MCRKGRRSDPMTTSTYPKTPKSPEPAENTQLSGMMINVPHAELGPFAQTFRNHAESFGLRLAKLPLTECGADHHWFLTLVNRFDTPLNGSSSSTLSPFKGTR